MTDHSLIQDSQTPALEGILRQLDLSGAAEHLAHRLAQAKAEQWPGERLLARILADEVERRAASATPRRMTVAEDGRWFQIDGRPAVSLTRRTALRRLLSAVLERRGSGAAASVQDMVQAGWPRETLSMAQGATRVYTAVRTLRRMGLENVLLTTDRGYEIATEVDVVRQPS